MSSEQKVKSLGEAIDRVIAALEGLDRATQITAIRAACEHLGVSQPSGSQPATVAAAVLATQLQSPTGSSSGSNPDIRTLKETKAPSSNKEMACVVAYYLQELAPPAERKDHITAGDLDKYFRQAGYPLPKAMNQLLVDTKDAGYFDSYGSGTYRLNPVGHNLVVHNLPRTERQPRLATVKKRSNQKSKPTSTGK